MDAIAGFFSTLAAGPWASPLLSLAALLFVAWVADWLTHRFLLRVVGRVIAATPTQWDDSLMGRGVLARLAHVVPALVVYLGVAAIPELPEALVKVARNVAMAWMVLTVSLAIGRLLNALGDVYQQRDPERARVRPIKGYLQVVKILVFVIAAILVIATLIERSPLLLLSGLGAMTAVLLLVFRDTLLSLVAAVQLSSHDMLRVGDWIQMPALDADGDVIDIALHTVKVQNWDKTITTIPTHRLIGESFKNWRGMSESGGRRIKRALLLDQTSVRFLTDEEREGLRRIALIDDYLARKKRELEDWNAKLLAEGKDPVNTRRVTNLGTFRAYVEAYLRAHPRIHPDMTLLVRQRDPGAEGIPLEIYCFTSTTAWAEYESIQSDIFDHLLAILPAFGLRVFQSPAGTDVQAALQLVQQRGP